MKQIHIITFGFLAVFLFVAVLVVQAVGNEQEKAEWLKYAKTLFDFKIPKGYDFTLPEGAGGGGEIYVNFSLIPKSPKDQNQKITVAVYVAGYPTMKEYIQWGKDYGLTDLGEVKVKGVLWHRYVPEGKNAKTYECHGTIKNDKQYEFCLDSGKQVPSSKVKKIYQTFLQSVKIK